MSFSSEYNLHTPDVFDEPWIVYGETRRQPDSLEPLSGNTAVSKSVLDSAYQLIQPDMDQASWTAQESQKAQERIRKLQQALGLRALGAIRPSHGTNIVDLNLYLENTSPSLPLEERKRGDVSVTTDAGIGCYLAPADCLVINLVNTKEANIAQIHAGYRGLAKNIIPRSLQTLQQVYRFSPKNTLAYISPHAQNNFEMYGKPLNEIASNPQVQSFLSPHDNQVIFDMTNFAKQQLIENGVYEQHLEISPDNTFDNPTLYSQRQAKSKGYNGRNAIVLGTRPFPTKIL